MVIVLEDSVTRNDIELLAEHTRQLGLARTQVPRDNVSPTHIKASLEYLDIQTLKYYGLRYENDPVGQFERNSNILID